MGSVHDVLSERGARQEVDAPLGTPAQVATFMHTTTAALAQDRYHRRGIPYVKHGRKVLYRWTDVYAYLEANTVNPRGVA